MRSAAAVFVGFLGLFAAASPARAFVGFHVARGDAPSISDATTVVVMRDGDRTIVSTRTSYLGPAVDSALVLPVPPSLGRERVRALRAGAFERIERLSAPRLVEYWERDPCPTGPAARLGRAPNDAAWRLGMRPPPVSEEARFSREGHDLVILNAGDSAGLVRWLRVRGYRVPDGAAAAIRPYVEAGYRFLIARFDASRATVEDGHVILPPIRFHFRSDDLVLPVRLASVGGARPHDLVVHVLARGHRFEAENRVNVLAPTNLVMYPSARERLGEVYATILHRVLDRHPGAIVTEYAWDAEGCEPCATPPLGPTDLETFGRDVAGPPSSGADGFVLTRLHTWIDAPPDADLVLRPAPPIAGGRHRPHGEGRFEQRIDRRTETNAFQARYAVLHRWDRPASCAAPHRGRWGTPAARRRPAALTAPSVTTIIPTGRLRRYLHSWTPVLRIPARGDAVPATVTRTGTGTARVSRRRGRRRAR